MDHSTCQVRTLNFIQFIPQIVINDLWYSRQPSINQIEFLYSMASLEGDKLDPLKAFK